MAKRRDCNRDGMRKMSAIWSFINTFPTRALGSQMEMPVLENVKQGKGARGAEGPTRKAASVRTPGRREGGGLQPGGGQRGGPEAQRGARGAEQREARWAGSAEPGGHLLQVTWGTGGGREQGRRSIRFPCYGSSVTTREWPQRPQRNRPPEGSLQGSKFKMVVTRMATVEK